MIAQGILLLLLELDPHQDDLLLLIEEKEEALLPQIIILELDPQKGLGTGRDQSRGHGLNQDLGQGQDQGLECHRGQSQDQECNHGQEADQNLHKIQGPHLANMRSSLIQIKLIRNKKERAKVIQKNPNPITHHIQSHNLLINYPQNHVEDLHLRPRHHLLPHPRLLIT